MTTRVPTPDSRPVWPFVKADLGVDTAKAHELGLDEHTPPEQLPRLVVTLFYRNRDLRQIELDYGSLEGMEEATAERPAEAIPHTLWLGLRHDPEWSDEERVRDLHGGAAWGVEAQVGVARALAAAMGGDPDAQEREVRKQFDLANAEDAGADVDAPALGGIADTADAVDLEDPPPPADDEAEDVDAG